MPRRAGGGSAPFVAGLVHVEASPAPTSSASAAKTAAPSATTVPPAPPPPLKKKSILSSTRAIAPPARLPRGLAVGGNAAAWTEFGKLLCASPSAPNAGIPIMVSGPVGCGKLYGVTTLLCAMNIGVDIVDASATLDDVSTAVKNAKQRRLMGQRKATVFHGINGFQPDAIAMLADMTRDIKGGHSGKRPLIIATCADQYAFALKHLRFFVSTKLFPPRDQNITQILQIRFPNIPKHQLEQTASLCGGDIRRAIADVARLEENIRKQRLASDGVSYTDKDLDLSLFQQTERLLRGTDAPDNWEANAMGDARAHFSGSGTHVQLLHHNYPELAARAGGSDLDRLEQMADMADTLALADESAVHISTTAHRFHRRLPTSIRTFPLRFPKVSGIRKATHRQSHDLWCPEILRDCQRTQNPDAGRS